MRVLLLCVCVALTTAIDLAQDHKSYKGYKVIEVLPTTKDQVDLVHTLSNDIEIDFWTKWRIPNLPVRFMLPPNKVGRTIDYIEDHGMDFRIINQDVGIQITNELNRLRSRADKNMAFDVNDYNTYDDIMTELDAMAARCPAALTCYVETLGVSEQGQPIKILRISAGTALTSFWMDATIHAREWLSTAAVLKLMDHFTRDYGSDANVTNLIDSYDWHFVPVVNPDGYEHTWANDRYWIKSRNDNSGTSCMGTNLNRNFDSHWSSDGTSTDPCSRLYPGANPTSEAETRVIETELDRLSSSLTCLLSVHNSAEAWLHPWGYMEGGQCARTTDYDTLHRVASVAANASQSTFEIAEWIGGTSCETISAMSGSTCDYGREGAGIVYSFSPELRGPDYVLPAYEIEPSFQEFYNGIKAMVAEIEAIAKS